MLVVPPRREKPVSNSIFVQLLSWVHLKHCHIHYGGWEWCQVTRCNSATVPVCSRRVCQLLVVKHPAPPVFTKCLNFCNQIFCMQKLCNIVFSSLIIWFTYCHSLYLFYDQQFPCAVWHMHHFYTHVFIHLAAGQCEKLSHGTNMACGMMACLK